MTGERARKRTAREHSRLLTAGDVDALLALYAPDAVFEDPVGSGARQGHEALRAHFAALAAGGAAETVEDTVAGQDGTHVLSRITAVAAYRPLGPRWAARGWLPPQTAEPAFLRRHYALQLRVGPAGLIEDMRAYWGRPDLEVSADGTHFTGPAELSPRERALRRLPETYLTRLTGGDVEGTVALFAEDVVFEDPVGGILLRGKDALREHVFRGSAGKVHEVLGRPVSSMDGRFVVIRGDARVRVPAAMRMRMITVCEIDDAGFGVHIRGYWGLGDLTMEPAPPAAPAAERPA